MRQEDRARLDLGLDRCIECARVHACPPDCPYTNEVVEGIHYDCLGVLLLDARQRIRELEDMIVTMRMPSPARLMDIDEVETYVGAAFAEEWLEADEEEGDPERKVIFPVGVCFGNLVFEDGCTQSWERLEKRYNKQYGTRLWKHAIPSTKTMEATPWKS